MVRPVNFAFNSQTAVNNAFQVASNDNGVHQKAIKEFDAFVDKLRSKKVDVIVVNDTPEPHTPDSIFPNNWISFHSNGDIVLYPMFAQNRRVERKQNVIEEIKSKFLVSHTIDLTKYEDEEKYLEGTGSIVLDRNKHIAYACVSPRTDPQLFNEFCRKMNYEPVLFHAIDANGAAIYHTNVMMCVAETFVVICRDSISDASERKTVTDKIIDSGKDVIDISPEQMNQFAGNMLQVNDAEGKKYMVMSTQAYESLTREQIAKLELHNEIIHSSLDTIEQNGGGSARCMMAEVHLQPQVRPNPV
jgi:hypothetical protein